MMQSKLENRSEFESKIKGNPIELLKAIKEHAMSFQETKWCILTIIDPLMRLPQYRLDGKVGEEDDCVFRSLI